MTKFLRISAVAAALCLLACNPDGINPDGNGKNDASDDARFWDVVGNLVSMNDITPDYKGKTFTPIIGNPDNGDESVRVVAANSLEYAVDLFNSMTGASVEESTTTYTWKDSAIGTMVWTKDDSGKAWATVDVNIPCVPTLNKIIYRSPAQGDVNGSVGDNGSAYYRFGDIISRTRAEDGVLEYWICVRPAFGPEGKGDSHWISISPLPEENIWPYNSTKPEQKGKPHEASNKMHYGLPYGLRDGSKQIQNLAELLYAIYFPDQYVTNVTNYSTESTFGSPGGLLIFNDFHVSNIKYHNEAFWSNVQKAWKEKGIARRVFGVSDQDLIAALTSERGLHFIHKSYSWSTTLSNKPKLYQVQQQFTTEDNKKRNMRKQTTSTVTAQVVTPKNYTVSNTNYPFDIKTETSVDKPYIQKQEFFGDNDPRWMVRFADGEELAENGKWDPQQPLSGFEKHRGGEVYRYYSDVFPDHNLTDAPEISDLRRGIVNDITLWNKSEYSGDHHYELGDVLRDDEGRNWFVVSIAGADQKSPYAEVICFDGIQTANVSAMASNIATKEQAQRVAVWLWFLFREAYKNPEGPAKAILANIKNNANVDLSKLAKALVGQNTSGQLSNIEHFSVAYSITNGARQNLMRYFAISTSYETFTYLWSKYPSSNITQLEKYEKMTSSDFSNLEICLQDIADANKVSTYGNDVIAKAPLNEGSASTSIRTNPDSRASNVSNYFYNASTWAAGTNPTGMWNEPVLFFRAAVLYDRGGEYSTKTKDGRTLTMVSKVTNLSQPTATWTHSMWSGQTGSYRKENGANASVPSWQSAWAQ